MRTATLELLLPLVNRAFDAPHKVLGTGERNTEIKIGLLVLWALGWNPVNDIALGAQIARHRFVPEAKAANAIDFLVGDEQQVHIIGEVKHWFTGDKAWAKGIEQLQRYHEAICAPRAFLTMGRRWLVLGHDSKPVADITARSGEQLIEELTPVLGRNNFPPSLRDTNSWRYALNPSDREVVANPPSLMC